MKNKFYTDFDFERVRKSLREEDYRTPFQIDRDRIIHSSEFRRLQGKTQVFLPGEYDFYRTRLTHSIEVAQIGRSICNYLFHKEKDHFDEEYFIDVDLVESACLTHDLGHPPFGHAGERTLNKVMRPYGGFEGNGQTLRLITEVFYKKSGKRTGMNPTRAFVDSILKYKALFSDFEEPYNHYIFDEQKKYVNFVFGEIQPPDELENIKTLNNFRSIECQIMDWADDTAYCVNDLVDSITGGFINIAKLSKWCGENESTLTKNQVAYVEELIEWIRSGEFKRRFGTQIGDFIAACSISERGSFLDQRTNRYKYFLEIDRTVQEKAEFYKRISSELVFQSTQLHQMEYKGNFMIKGIFEAFVDNYVDDIKQFKLLPDFSDKIIRAEEDKNKRARLVCDYIAGMTDAYAMRTFRRLYNPDFSSLADIV